MSKDAPKPKSKKASPTAGLSPEAVAQAQAQGPTQSSGLRLEQLVAPPVDTAATGGMHPFMLPVGAGTPMVGSPSPLPASQGDPVAAMQQYLAANAPAQLPAQAATRNTAPMPTSQAAPRGLGGMDLGAVAQGARGETNQRIAGQGSLMDAYLEQVLGQANAQNAAAGERDGRMQDFERQRALMQETLQRSRMGQDEALQRARIEAAASEGMSDRDQRGILSAEQRAFELGQAATTRESDDLQQRMLELQIQQMEQELGGQQSFGQYDVSADRGSELSAGRQNEIRGKTFTDTAESGARQWSPGWDFGTRQEETTTLGYDDLIGGTRGIVDQYGIESQTADPIKFRQELLALARNQPQLASLLLADIGYYTGPPAQ